MSFGKMHRIPQESTRVELAYAAGAAEAQMLKDADALQAIVLGDYIAARESEDKLLATKQLCESPNFKPFFSGLVAQITAEMLVEPIPESDEVILTMFEQHLYGGEQSAVAESTI
jgi:hypothetical protein